jgi:Ras family protein T1
VATKSDLDLALQVGFASCDVQAVFDDGEKRHEVQPDVYCRRLGLQVPVAVSVKTEQTADVFYAICRVAMNP